MQHAFECEYTHIKVDSGQLILQNAPIQRRALDDQVIAAHYGKPPVYRKVFDFTGSNIKQHDVVSSAIFTEKGCDTGP